MTPAGASSQPPQDAALRSVHTTSFPALLNQLGISLVVSTYQAGKLIVVRADGDILNTHFRIYKKPMGLAADAQKLAIGTESQIWELRNVPAAAPKVPPLGKHDACYLPRQIHITGDIDIHEMAWLGNELWFINTRFSCLCVSDRHHSFVPRWRPPFISAYDLQDRCHLNGLGIRDGQPRYVTALGETDTPSGWRQNKANGGILMDITTNEILLRGLSMPHSPRWYDNRLWFLESGHGSLAQVDLVNRRWQAVAQLPGFTRGLDFYGQFAFIGLSQVRETAVFSGIPLTRTLSDRICGVWVVNLLNGETVAFLRFEEAVQEIFGVSVLPGIRFPEVIDWDDTLIGTSYVLPDEALANVVLPPQTVESAHGHFLRGNELHGQGKLQDAILAYRRCLELQPDYLPARYNLGVTLGDLEQFAAAIAELQQVIAAEASHADAHNSLGFAYSRQRQPYQGIYHYEQATKLRPDFAKAHHNLGMTLLQVGEYAPGWAECEWRWQTDSFHPFECPQPQWDGSPLGDRTLLIHTEQGAGDAIQFARFIPLAAQRCGKIILACTPNLAPLFNTIDGIAQIQTPGEIPLSAFDTYIPLMSLPHVLKVTLSNLPAQVPYLRPPAQPFPAIAAAAKVKVGFVWAGSPTQAADHERSTGLSDWLPLLSLPDIQFYSLQKGDRTGELRELPKNLAIVDLDAHLNDYGDTAAAIAQLDLVISVDTSVAHLAGALGKPVWALLCYCPDWRWLLEREDTPWYPTMRLFRQSQPGDWASVFARVQIALQSWAKRYPQGTILPPSPVPNLAVQSLSIVVPVYNVIRGRGRAVFERTLQSIEASITFLRQHYACGQHITCEIVLVDDGSTDETPICLAELAQGSLYRVLRHETNLGIAAARNTGVRESQGQAISFCDADDCFLETHLFQVLAVLNQPVTHPAPNLQRCGDYPAAVKTRVRTQEVLHPEWQRRVEWSIPLNLCLRRQVHEFLGGFPEENAFRECSYGTEDSAYSHWLHQFFQVVTLPIVTVEHFRYPGNHLDKQLARFQHPPGAYRESVCDRDRQLLADIDGIIEVRSQRLRDKPPVPWP